MDRVNLTRYPSAQMRAEYITGVRAKGFGLTSVTGTTEEQLSLSGLGKQLLGIAFYAADGVAEDLTLTLKVNNDVVLEKVPAASIERDSSNPREYFQIYRPLTGQDSIFLQFTDGTGAQAFNVVLYYTQGNS